MQLDLLLAGLRATLCAVRTRTLLMTNGPALNMKERTNQSSEMLLVISRSWRRIGLFAEGALRDGDKDRVKKGRT